MLKPQNNNWLNKLKIGLKSTSNKITNQITKIISNRPLDDKVIEELEEALILSDIGIETTDHLIKILKKEKFNKNVTVEEVKRLLSTEIEKILHDKEAKFQFEHKPHILLMCGVNGNGKTTTTAKLANLFKNQGHKVLVAACDTFRAAAVEQLESWCNKLNIDIFIGQPNQDPASVAYMSLDKAIKENYDILIIDTAGRLHTKNNLMDELKKIINVLSKLSNKQNQDTILVLDGTTGQNALKQVETFKSYINLTGLIVTKLDGTAKGGMIVAIAKEYNLPIFAIGIGESIDDLLFFNAKEFTQTILSDQN